MLGVGAMPAEETAKQRAKRQKAARHRPRFEGLRGRLLEMLQEVDVSDRETSLKADASHGFVASIVGRMSTNPAAIPLALLCEAYGYNVRWLITGLGKKIVDPKDDTLAALERGDAQTSRERVTANDVAQRLLDERPTRKVRGAKGGPE